MSTRYETSIDLRVAPGATLWALWGVSHALAVAASLTLPSTLGALAVTLVGASAFATVRRWRRSWHRLLWSGWGGIQAVGPGRRSEFVELGDEHFVTPHVVVLTIRKEKRVMRFPVFGWEQAEALRRLNQRLQAGHAAPSLEIDKGDRKGV